MRDATSTELREIAGTDLYRRNAFRITGLPTTVDRRTARQRQQQLNAALQVGADIDTGSGTPADPDEVRAAFDRILGDPRRRLVEELFGYWDTDDKDCLCPSALHRAHDAAVRAHAAVLDQEVPGKKPSSAAASKLSEGWRTAADNWKTALASPAFWSHLRHRIKTLDDRQLTFAAADSLRTELPLALLKPLTDLAALSPDPARLATQARKWPAPQQEIDLRMEEVAAPLYDEVDTELRKAMEFLDAGDAERAAHYIYSDVRPPLQRLIKLVPPGRHRRTAEARDRVSVALNNCATKLIEAGQVFDGRAEKWLKDAAELSTPRGMDTIRQNQSTLVEMRDALDRIASEAAMLQSMGLKSQARAMLRDVKRSIGNGPGSTEIDRMIRDLNLGRTVTTGGSGGGSYRPPTHQPSEYRPGGYQPSTYRAGGRRTGRRWGRTFVKLLVAAAIIFAIIRFWPFGDDSRPGAVFAPLIKNNAPIGTCLQDEKSWQKDKSKVKIVDCGDKHWGEVIAYLKVTKFPAQYPGRDQAEALASFLCGEALAQQGIPADKYTTSHALEDEDGWNTLGVVGRYENYTTCVAHQKNNKTFDERIGHPDKPKVPKPVTMKLAELRIRDNAPIGLCLQSAPTEKSSQAPIVRCEVPHWGELLGYTVMAAAGSEYPGDDAVKSSNNSMCVNLFNQRHPKAPGLRHWSVYPGPGWWEEDTPVKYGYCVMLRTDEKPFKGKP